MLCAAMAIGLVTAGCWSPQTFRLNGYTIDNATTVLRQAEQTFRADVAARGGTVSSPGRCYFLEPLAPSDNDVGCGPVSVPGAATDARWELFPMQVALANAGATHGPGSLGSPTVGPLRTGDRLVRPDLREIDIRSDDSSDLRISDAPPPPVNPAWIGAAMALMFLVAAGALGVWLIRTQLSKRREEQAPTTVIYLAPTSWEAAMLALAQARPAP
ncbi:MAG: hypothetical protein JO265_01690, partial [Acidimicrobiia bacterium]|nr:hypothetical protein [Acidimicrobiia bacterium]